MKKDEVPQDKGYLDNTSLRDIYYATDGDGRYCQVASEGWYAKTDALTITWDSIRDEAETVRQDVLRGRKSPLAYHILMRLFDAGLLSAYSGIPKKTIKKHLKAGEFEKADGDTLQKYADTLNITVEELKKV
ncbi:MAG: hypothetical protein LBT42_08935 [Tannerella sp.]|jgi:hypothetical protein|nr:hypothetical protein [Tannerella sp.]